MNKQVWKKIESSRSAMVLDEPFFGSVIVRPDFIEDFTCETVWVDGVSLGYNPDFVDSCDFGKLKFIFAHESMHLVLGHHVTRGNREPEMWNDACDYCVNAALVKSGYKLPDDALFSDEFDDMSAERIYAILESRRPKDNQDQQDEPDQDQDDQDSPKSGQGDTNGPEDGQGQGQAEKSGAQGKGQGEVRDYPGDPDGDGSAPTESDMQQEKQKWEIVANQAAIQAESFGMMPGGAMEEIRIMNQSKVPWQAVIQRFVEAVSFNDWSWVKPNLRYADSDFFMPSLHSKELLPIVYVVDSSCSVTSDELVQAASEIETVLTIWDTTVTVMSVDTEVRDVVTLSRQDFPIKLDIKGRGGTAFSPAFRHINKMDEQPCCVIYFTDLECDDFGPEPDYPVLWVQTAGRRIHDVPFGEVVTVN